MQINISINNTSEIETLSKLASLTYEILLKFINNCPQKYKHLIKKLKKTPFALSFNNKFKNTYATATYGGSSKNIKLLIIEVNNNLKTFNEKQLKLIISHELAHSIDFLDRGDNDEHFWHDSEWKKLAVILEAQPTYTIDINK